MATEATVPTSHRRLLDWVEEMVTLFYVTGGYTYVDPYGKALGYEDVFTKLDNARRHYLGFKWSSQHLERGGCDDCSEAAFGSVWARRLALAWSALCCAA